MQRLIHLTRSFLLRTHCSGRDLSRIVGNWTWACLVRRECLSVFRHVYRYISIAGDRVFSIWNSVRLELSTMIGLAPLMYADLTSGWCDRVVASDACSTGLGVVMGRASAEAMCAVARCAPVPTPTESELNTSFTAMGLGIRTWTTVISSPFRFTQHINTLELHSVHTALRWLLTHPAAVCKRVLLLCDNQVVVAALSKGRSSAPTLVSPLRRLCCLVLAGGLRVSYRWIPSELNPADGPSRAHAPRC